MPNTSRMRWAILMEDGLPLHLSFSEQFAIQREKFNRYNWRAKGRFYGVGITDEGTQIWQPGWVGGGMSSYALMKLGGETEWERGMDTLRHLFRTQAKSGLFHGVYGADGKVGNDGFGCEAAKSWVLIRKSADILHFLFKHFRLMQEREREFGRLNMKTVGSVFANVQNKHSAPGICTLSGDSLYKLYRWTKDERYLQMLREISLTISQYMSRQDRPIYSRDEVPEALLPGVICERVNMSDWEGENLRRESIGKYSCNSQSLMVR